MGGGHEDQSAEGAEWGWVWEGCHLPSRLGRLGSVVIELSQRGSGWPETHVDISLGHRTLLADKQMRFFAQCKCAKFKILYENDVVKKCVWQKWGVPGRKL